MRIVLQSASVRLLLTSTHKEGLISTLFSIVEICVSKVLRLGYFTIYSLVHRIININLNYHLCGGSARFWHQDYSREKLFLLGSQDLVP